MSNFDTGLAALQRVGLHGGSLTHEEHRILLACIRASGGGAAAVSSNTAVQAAKALVTTGDTETGTLKTDTEAQFDILDAFTGASDINAVVAAIATASALLRADVVTAKDATAAAKVSADSAGTLSTAALAAAPAVSTLTSNPVIDGVW